MALVQVDDVDAEPPQARVTCLSHILGPPADPPDSRVVGAHDPELRRKDDLVAAAVQPFAEKELVRTDAVHVGRVQERDPEVDRAMDRPDRFSLVRCPVELGHAHAAEPDRRDDEAVRAELALLHALRLHRPGRSDSA